jgi:hypothetical protein
MTMRIGIGLMAAGLALAACDPSVYRDSTTPIVGYGNSVRQNSAVMIVDPQPVSAANVDLDFDGRRGGIAIERYRSGKVIPPVQQRTSDVLPGGGGGSGTGGQ